MVFGSHELKTPLTSAKAFVQLMAKNIEPESQLFPFITKANERLNRLERLIADLLTYRKLTPGNFSMI